MPGESAPARHDVELRSGPFVKSEITFRKKLSCYGLHIIGRMKFSGECEMPETDKPAATELRKPWVTPQILVAKSSDTEVKGYSIGDQPGYGSPTGS